MQDLTYRTKNLCRGVPQSSQQCKSWPSLMPRSQQQPSVSQQDSRRTQHMFSSKHNHQDLPILHNITHQKLSPCHNQTRKKVEPKTFRNQKLLYAEYLIKTTQPSHEPNITLELHSAIVRFSLDVVWFNTKMNLTKSITIITNKIDTNRYRG